MQGWRLGGSALLLLEMPCSRAKQGQSEDAHLDNEDRHRNKWNDNTPRCAVVQGEHSCGSLGSDTAYKQWGLTCQTEGASSSRLTLRRVASGSGLGSSVLTGRGRGQGSLLDQPTSSYPLQREGAMRPSASAVRGCSGHTICHQPQAAHLCVVVEYMYM